MSSISLKGSCYCKAVSYQVIGTPILSAYCHCTLCQRLTACPFVLTIHFPASSFSWTHDNPVETTLDSFSVSDKPWKIRWRCKVCGSAVTSQNIKANKWSVWGSQLERDGSGKIKNWEVVKPTAHIFYETRLLDINDDLGKWTGYENQSEKITQ